MALQQINDREYNDCDGGPITRMEKKKKKGNELTNSEWFNVLQRAMLFLSPEKGNNHYN